MRKLLEIGGRPLAANASDPSTEAIDRLGEVGASLDEMIRQKNGFFCFESALRVFPSVTVEASWGLADWNSPDLWKIDYRGLADDVFCFAEDVFGQQFVVQRGEIGVFDTETAEVEIVGSSLEEWASKLLLDYKQMTGHGLAHDWQRQHGPLHPRHRLMSKTPFVLGGEYSLSNLVALDARHIMQNRGNLAHQIHSLPDDTQIKFEITRLDS